MRELLPFEEAFKIMKLNKNCGFIRRRGWNNPDIRVYIQWPDENSFMTEPYLFMSKGTKNFPLDLSSESLFAKDWDYIEGE